MNESYILIVDDVPSELKMVTAILENSGYHIKQAATAAEALAIIEKRLPDLVLLDIILPDMDGYDVCTILKHNSRTREIPIIFLTAKTDSEDLVRGFESGGVDYITKPCSSTEVLARVKTHLELKKISQERKELIHILCHDLVTPLSAIQSLLKLDWNCPDLDILKKSLLSTSDNGLKIIKLVQEMLALDDQKTVMHLEPVKVEDIIADVAMFLKHRLKNKNITLVTHIEPGLTVMVERISFLNSVMINLLTNAIKFSFPDSAIEITAEQTGDMVSLSVRDFGMGMSDILRRDVFLLKKPTTRKGTQGEVGTGYGLPLVKKFVDAYRGAISIVSNEIEKNPHDHGTEIILTLKAGEKV